MNQSPVILEKRLWSKAAAEGPIPLSDLAFDQEEIEAVVTVLKSGWLTMADRTRELEEAFARMTGVKHALAVTNGTAALHLAAVLLAFQSGDEVITTSFTFVATVNSLLWAGARPVFADITSLTDLNIDAEAIEEKITPRTKAIMVVHLAGRPCRMELILATARRHGLVVMEDCAHSPGGYYRGRALGAWGAAGCFSFYSNKNMTTGEGGMIVTDDDALAARAKLLRSHGLTSSAIDRHRGLSAGYDVAEPGFNYRLDEMRAVLGLTQLNRLAVFNQRRRELDDLYLEILAEEERLILPFAADREGVCHIRPIILPLEVDRDAFRTALKGRGVQTSIHYPPVHRLNWFRDRFPEYAGRLPWTEEAGRREVTLPLYPLMSEAQVEYVCRAVRLSLDETWKR
ncbi:MAG: DegT/DnrJ/EryC1/StrS aminotransferase family protein [Thermodesulfobacteriota bacterium]